MTRKHPDFRVRLLRTLRPWHRRIGIISSVLVLLLTLTGLALSHSRELNLSQGVYWQWLQDYYGIGAPEDVKVWQAQPLAGSSQGLAWIAGTPLAEQTDEILAIAPFEGKWLLLTRNSLTILSQDLAVLETQTELTGLPPQINAMAVEPGSVWLKTSQGQYRSDSELLDWQAATSLVTLPWIKPLEGTKIQTQQLLGDIRASRLSWHRILLDLHSGRIFGAAGSYLMDLVAIALLLLAVTGLIIYLKQKR